MFQSSDNAQRSLVTLHFSNGSKAVASLRLSMAGKLSEVLNNQDRFLDVITSDGQQQYVSKSSVLKVEIVDPPKARLNQQRRNSDRSQFDPHAILGVSNSTGKDEMRSAYIQLVKSYHPDRFANLDLPQEMKDYAAAMQARINMAYDQLKD